MNTNVFTVSIAVEAFSIFFHIGNTVDSAIFLYETAGISFVGLSCCWNSVLVSYQSHSHSPFLLFLS